MAVYLASRLAADVWTLRNFSFFFINYSYLFIIQLISSIYINIYINTYINIYINIYINL